MSDFDWSTVDEFNKSIDYIQNVLEITDNEIKNNGIRVKNEVNLRDYEEQNKHMRLGDGPGGNFLYTYELDISGYEGGTLELQNELHRAYENAGLTGVDGTIPEVDSTRKVVPMVDETDSKPGFETAQLKLYIVPNAV